MSRQSFKGQCMGVELTERGGPDDPHVQLTLLVEDDEVWHPKMILSSYWLDELITQLTAARAYMRSHCHEDPSGYGYTFAATTTEETS